MNELSALDILRHPQSGDESDIKEAMVCAISALEKQIPKKPIKERHFTIHPYFQFISFYFCPTCKGYVKKFEEIWTLPKPINHYCKKCGQKLDWSDTDE